MQKNTGSVDRALRVIAGVGLGAVAFLAPLPTPVLIVAGVFAVVALGTSLAGFCPLYRLFGISTCPIPAGRGG